MSDDLLVRRFLTAHRICQDNPAATPLMIHYAGQLMGVTTDAHISYLIKTGCLEHRQYMLAGPGTPLAPGRAEVKVNPAIALWARAILPFVALDDTYDQLKTLLDEEP